MANDSYFQFADNNKVKFTNSQILTIVSSEMDKLITHSPIYCTKGNWENSLTFSYILDKIYLTIILCLMPSDKSA